ncbi:hypothetical protein QTJ16_005365 [Diplocarpon rosae]|uniref:Glycosyltransferase 2-like domain-containing protein n=1 Tax=Diplocarpon rosae TaxID=946125 RepID=A0AAD9SWF0_9HELO|nr:hypothetical protein QTJ16_005365 [Diplocarpon rosae]
MSFLKSYFAPTKAAKKTGKKNEPPTSIPMVVTPPRGQSRSSQPATIYPVGDYRNESRQSALDTKGDVLVSWLHQRQCEKMMYTSQPDEGVVLKMSKDRFLCAPAEVRDSIFYEQVTQFNVKCAITVRTRLIWTILDLHSHDFVPLNNGLRLQIIPSMDHLHQCQKHQFATFVRREGMMVVWADQPKYIYDRCTEIETLLMEEVWDNEEAGEKKSANKSVVEVASRSLSPAELEDALRTEKRPTLLINSVIVGLTLILLTSALGRSFRAIAQEIQIDGDYTRLVLLFVTPCQIFVSLFFMQIVVVNLFQMFGPISQVNINSKFYSGIAPRRLNRNRGEILPHFTIQMPVYKEGLRAVIEPTILSLKTAISTYELQGGTANIFVNDDGMQLVSEEDARERREFYEEHSIGWVARPNHNAKRDIDEKAFIRKGKFKKASNMNYGLMISNRVEEKLLQLERADTWTHQNEMTAYDQSLAEVLAEEQGRAWAEGNIRIGDYILLIDSDTRVPADCLLDAASEMEQSPEVGILQYSSGVMQVTTSFFENGITFFTDLIYTAICYTVANGDVSPFVGHNAILRWSALQQVAYEDEDGYEKFWSESHVSEDFDMALRLQCAGYIIRLGSYTGEGFKEGVSLTVYDELNRWEKYAFGCNELLFHPFRDWLTRGPFTPLFRKFLFSNIRITSKITILAYIGTYYAIGAAWILTVANYFLIGWFSGHLDKYYLDSFKVYFSLILVFSVLGNLSLAVLRYRLDQRSLLGSLLENFKWLLLMTCFLGGISLHVSQSILCHFFSIEMSWGSTAKEVDNVTFFEELPRLGRRFKWTFAFCFISATAMIVLAVADFIPYYWRIKTFIAIYPLATVVASHFALPIVLNPALMTFTW